MYAIRSYYEIKFSESVQAGTTEGYSNDTYSGYTGAIISAIYMPPSASVYDSKGNFGGVVSPDNLKYAGAYGDIVNPVATLERKDVYNPEYYVRSTSSLDLELFSGLTFNSMFTVAGNQQLEEEFIVITSYSIHYTKLYDMLSDMVPGNKLNKKFMSCSNVQ